MLKKLRQRHIKKGKECFNALKHYQIRRKALTNKGYIHRIYTQRPSSDSHPLIKPHSLNVDKN